MAVHGEQRPQSRMPSPPEWAVRNLAGVFEIGERIEDTTVYHGKNANSQEEVIIKLPKKFRMLHRVQNELSIHYLLAERSPHPHICRLRGIHGCILIMERLETDLFYFVQSLGKQKASRREREDFAKEMTRQGLRALAHCHRHFVCHGDLKLENFLVSLVKGILVIKLTDFGESEYQPPGHLLTSQRGTPEYGAPEIWRGDAGYGLECDLWSFGVVVYMVISGHAPFGSQKVDAKRIMAAEYSFPHEHWRGFSADAQDFIRALLQLRPEDRMTAEDAMNHKWLSEDHVEEAETETPKLWVAAVNGVTSAASAENKAEERV